MKRMKLGIAETSIILYIIGVVIEAHYNAISRDGTFLTLGVLENALAYAWFYLASMYILADIRMRDEIFAYLRNMFIVQLILIVLSDTEVKAVAPESLFNWRNILLITYMVITFLYAKHQAKMLSEEYNSNSKQNEANNDKFHNE